MQSTFYGLLYSQSVKKGLLTPETNLKNTSFYSKQYQKNVSMF